MASAAALPRPSGAAAHGKLYPLEGMRGLAAMIVVAWHFVWAFAPEHLGSVAGYGQHTGLIGSPVVAAIDGPAAVVLFFVLSGFVLPLGFLRSGQSRVVARAAAKRWLRLAGLSVPAVLLAWLLFHFGLFHFRRAAELTQSQWLRTYGGGVAPDRFHPSLAAALREGLIGSFLHGSNVYDPVLWTMHHELLGSFVTLGSALLVRRMPSLTGCATLLLVAAGVALVDPWLIPFATGTGLAFLLSRHQLRLGWSTALACIAAGLYLFGYLEPKGIYAGFVVLQDQAGYRYDRILTHTVAGVLLMLPLIGHGGIGRLLGVRPFRWLGRVSFPVYLFHFPLLCSFGCGLFLLLQPRAGYGMTLALVALVYVPVVLGVGLLFARVDELWVVWLNRMTDRLLRPRLQARPAE